MPVFLVVAGLGAAMLVMLGIGRVYWNRRVAKWADEHALTLVDFSGAGLFEGPRAFRRSDNQFAFRVVVEDGLGRRRTGWLTFGSFWGFWPTGRPEIRWES